MTNRLKLSILIPTYNREKFIVMAIESVLNQEFSDFEIICCDNASTDKTYEILEQFAKKDKRIKIFQNEYNLGPVLNWKRCLDNASGEFVHWLWSDDWIESNFYVDAFNLMDNDNTRIVSSWNYRSDNLEDPADKYPSWQFSYPYISGEIAAKKILLFTYELPLSPAAYILPLELVKKHFYLDIPKLNDRINPVKMAVGVDSLMIIGSCLDVENISILQKPSVVFRQHDNISSEQSKDGNLSKMYMLSHLWFMSRNQMNLNLIEYLFLIKKTSQVFFQKSINYKILNYLRKLLFQVVDVFNFKISIFDYDSKKALLKEKINVILSDKLSSLNLENKRVYLAPYNNVTEELYKKFSKSNPKSIVFIDNFRKDKNVITSKQIQEYDYIFIYSPNYEMEIAKTLPKKNLFLIKQLDNDVYDIQIFSKSYNLKKIFKLCIDSIKLKNESLFNIGTTFLSEDMKKNDFSNKIIYLTPHNKLTNEIFGELKKYNENIEVKYIDNRYKKDNIVRYNEVKEYDYIFIDTSSLKNKLIKLLPKKNKFFLHSNIKNKINIYPYNYKNLFKQTIKKFFNSFYFNSFFKIRIFFASSLNFPLHTNEKKILNLKNKYEGKRAFILGNGPSLKIDDLNKLQNEVTFAANKIYLAYSETKWRPTYYSIEDNLVMHEIYDEVVKLEDSTLLFPIKDYKVNNDSIYYPLKRHSGGFSGDMLAGLYPGHTVTYSMLQMAVYMGIKEIYFIGLDFNYELPSNVKNETDIIYHEKELNHFHKDYRKPGDKWVKPNSEAQIKAYEIAREFCKNNNIKIYNASRSTKLEVFPLIDFDTLFNVSEN